MKRKVIKLGTATLVVSLPSKWTRKFNLKQGDEIDLEEENSNLLLQTKKGIAAKKEITIDLTDRDEKGMEIILTHVYRRGFEKIIVKNVNEDILKTIRKVVKNLLLGFEISKRTSDSCIIENLAEPTEQKGDVLLRRIFLMVKEMQNKILADFEKKDYNDSEIEEIRSQTDRFTIYYRRILSKESEKEATFRWELLTTLMRIDHSYHYMYKYANENNLKPDKDILSLLKDLQDYFQILYDSLFNKDINKIKQINKLRKEFQYGKCLRYLETKKGKNVVLHSFIRDIFRTIQLGQSSVISLILSY